MGEAPLQGRVAQVDQVFAALADPGAHGAVLRGPAGVGKSRLAAEVLTRAATAGCSVVEVRATETSRNVPFGAFAALVPALGSEANPLTAATGPVLAHREPATRLVLLVDDAHWLDDVSAALVRHLADHHDVFAVLTMRSGERTSDAVRALWRERSIRVVNVGALDDADVVAIAEALLGGELDANAAADLAALAAGNALAAVELVRGGQDAGLWECVDGRWVAGDLTRSTAVTELVAARLDRLDDEGRLLVELVAFGEPVPLDAFAGGDLGRLSDLEERAIVAVRSTGSRPEVWVAHPLHGELIRRDVSSLRRRSVLADLVQRMALASDDADRLRVALWSLEAGIALDADQLASAARRAFVTHRFDLAAQLLRAVPAERRTDVQSYQFLIAAWWVGARAMFDEALAGARRQLPSATGSGLAARFAEFERLSGDMRAGAGRADPPGGRPSANTLTRTPPGELVAFFADNGLDRIPDRDDPDRLVQSRTLTALALALTHAGRPLRAQGFADAAFELHSESWNVDPLALAPTHPVAALTASVITHTVAGDVHGAQSTAGRSADFDRGADVAVLDAYAALAHGFAAHRAGALRRAQQQFTRAAKRFDRSLHAGGPMWVLAHSLAAHVAALRRDVDTARRYLPRSEQAAESLFGTYVGVAAGWIAVADRDLTGAADRFADAAERCLTAGHVYFTVEALTGLTRIGRADRAVVHVGALADVEGPLLTGLRDAIVATAERDTSALLDLAERFERIGALADAAEVGAEAVRQLSRAGYRRDATAAATKVRHLLARCDGLDTPGVVIPVDPVALTDREREVALLAADRVPAKEIAERLFISRRTVTNHLQRVYDKLGVGSRTELRAALGVAHPVG